MDLCSFSSTLNISQIIIFDLTGIMAGNHYLANSLSYKIYNKKNSAKRICKDLLLTTNIGRNLFQRFRESKSFLFKSVELETTSVCNRKCSYCPNSLITRPSGYMEEKLFYKIIDELAVIGFSGRFSPHFYGEPLLDKRVVDFITYTKKKLPNVFIKLFTNGDLLSYELFIKLLDAGVDIFRISQHGTKPSKVLSECIKKVGDKMWSERVEYLRYVDTDTVLLMNRGGIINTNRRNSMKSCEQVSDLIIDYEGNVLLCCQDYLSKNVFGNLKNEGVMEVWNKKHFKSLRDKINGGIWSAEICRKCVDGYQE